MSIVTNILLILIHSLYLVYTLSIIAFSSIYLLEII